MQFIRASVSSLEGENHVMASREQPPRASKALSRFPSRMRLQQLHFVCVHACWHIKSSLSVVRIIPGWTTKNTSSWAQSSAGEKVQCELSPSELATHRGLQELICSNKWTIQQPAETNKQLTKKPPQILQYQKTSQIVRKIQSQRSRAWFQSSG